MEDKKFLLVGRNTGQMLLIEKILRDQGIVTEIVPIPPKPGLVCTRAVKINGSVLPWALDLLKQKKVEAAEILEESNSTLIQLLS